jgi:purine-nucleoside phosphorylase
MSTVNEVIAARHAGMRVLGLSVISNVAGDPLDNVAQDVLAASAAAAGNLRDLVAAIISRLPALERRID